VSSNTIESGRTISGDGVSGRSNSNNGCIFGIGKSSNGNNISDKSVSGKA